MTQTQIVIVFSFLIFGFWYYVNQASKDRQRKLTFGSFFLGGGRVGSELTTHSNWGLGFSFANGFWFNVALGYSFGLFVLLSGLLWSLSIVAVGLLLPYIRKATKEGDTIHGFIGKQYNIKAQYLACIATTIGYILNFGFEIYYSSEIFSSVLGHIEMAFPLALLLGILCSFYCMIGGYSANARTDKPQNYIGLVGVILLIGFLFFAVNGNSQQPSTIQASHFSFSLPPNTMLIGFIVFLSLFNIVDMANWQMIAANKDLPDTKIPDLKKSFYKSAAIQYLIPSIIGCFTGILLRGIPKLTDPELLPKAFGISFGNFDPIIAAALIGLILFGLISTSLSSGDTYLLAATHTLSIDLLKRKRYNEILKSTIDDDAEHKFVKNSKIILLIVGILSICVFYWWYTKNPSRVIQLQFIMYGSALSMLPSVVYAFYCLQKRNSVEKGLGYWAFASILIGVITVLIPYTLIRTEAKQDFANLSPLLTLSSSLLVFTIGLIFKRLSK